MSFPRLALLALGLPLLTAACGAPLAVTAVSYGADGVSLVDSGKSTSDHFISMVSKKDCAMWRILRNRTVCQERTDGRDPYKVDYDQANRMPSEDGVSYAPPLHATPDAPATSWTTTPYKPEPVQTAALPPGPVDPAPVIADAPPAPPPAVAAKPGKSGKSAKKKAKAPVVHHAKAPVVHHAKAPVVHHAKAVRKPSPGQVASVP